MRNKIMDYYNNKAVNPNVLNGKIITKIDGLFKDSVEVVVHTQDGYIYVFAHDQDCCEHVALNDYELSAESLSGGLVVSAEEVQGIAEAPETDESYTWTFYKIETNKGGLWMRWLGESSGYYSEEVLCYVISTPEDADLFENIQERDSTPTEEEIREEILEVEVVKVKEVADLFFN